MTESTYAAMAAHAGALLRAGWNVILDATYLSADHRAAARAAADAADAAFHIVHLTAPEAVLRERIAQRARDVSDATPELVSQQLAHFDDFTPHEQACLVTVDTTQRADIDAIVRRLTPEHGNSSRQG
jgi:hypothetical protein